MLILVVVVAILATNLFMGFFIAHYLGYGPQNFQELWTGVYLRPLGNEKLSGPPEPLDSMILDSMTRAAAAALVPPCHDALEDASEIEVADADVATIVLRSLSVLRHSGLVLERHRLLDQEAVADTPVLPLDSVQETPLATDESVDPHETVESDPSTLSGEENADNSESVAEPFGEEELETLPEFHWKPEAIEQLLASWQDYLHQVQPEFPLPWWAKYLSHWSKVQSAWREYIQMIASLKRIEIAERDFQLGISEVVCESEGCRRVTTVAATSWWQRPAAELRTLAWAQSQKQRLVQEIFEQFVSARTLEQSLLAHVCRWLGNTYKPEVFADMAKRVHASIGEAAWGAPVTEPSKSDGFLVLIAEQVNWVTEFCRGSVVSDAFIQHRQKKLGTWFSNLPRVANDTQQPASQRIDERTTAVWLPTSDLASAEMTAWTMASSLACPKYTAGDVEVEQTCRLLLISLTAKQDASRAIQLGRKLLRQSEHPIWEKNASPVWTWNGKKATAVERPKSLPNLVATVELAGWYVERMIDMSAPACDQKPTLDVSKKEDSLSSKTAVADSTDVGDNASGDNSELPVNEDDGIDW